MDSETIYQDVQRCQMCEKDIAELFCVYCKTRHCKKCIGIHLTDDPEKHKIVKNHEKYTTLLLPKCATHSKERCKNYCDVCNRAVCSLCISSESHERHKFLKIDDIFNQRKESIKNDTDELEQDILPSYVEIAKQLEFDRIKNETKVRTVFYNLQKQGERWHRKIDHLVDTIRKNLGYMHKRQMEVQKEHMQRTNQLLFDVQQIISLNKKLLESLEISELLSYESMNSTLKRLPPKLEISVPRFIPRVIEKEFNEEQIGVITGFCISNQEGGYQLKSQSGTVSGSNDNESEKIAKEVMNEPAIIALVETKIEGPKNIACTNDGKLWVSGEEGQVRLINFFRDTDASKILKNVPAGRNIKEIAVTKKGDLLFGRIQEILILKDGKIEPLIHLKEWSLLSFCVTAKDNLLVCMIDAKRSACRVVRFHESEDREIIQYDSEGEKLFAPGNGRKYVKENLNGDVCVADCDGEAVVVMDRAGEFRFRYNERFCPLGIATDSQAQLIVPYTDRVHIINMNGHFLQYLNIAQQCTDKVRLSVDSEDNLYFSETESTVKKIQYMTSNR